MGVGSGVRAVEFRGCGDFLGVVGAAVVFDGVGFGFVVFDFGPAVVAGVEGESGGEVPAVGLAFGADEAE